MVRQLLILAFQDNLGHRLMSELVGRGFLWCSGTPANKANATSIWVLPADEPMALTVWVEPLLQSEEQLGDLLACALEHHPQVISVEVLGFEDTSKARKIAEQHGFLSTTFGRTHVYSRAG